MELSTAGKPLRHYRVSLAADGSRETVVAVEERMPFTRRIVRHEERTRELGDGRKRTELVPVEVNHTYDTEAEMRADAVRAFNSNGNSSFCAKQLSIEAVRPAAPQEPSRPPKPLSQHSASPERPSKGGAASASTAS